MKISHSYANTFLITILGLLLARNIVVVQEQVKLQKEIEALVVLQSQVITTNQDGLIKITEILEQIIKGELPSNNYNNNIYYNQSKDILLIDSENI